MSEAFMHYHPDPLIRDYQDRGMMKWLGFYLSEHTAEMEKDARQKQTILPRKAPMTEGEIGSILETAFIQQRPVSIQLAFLDEEGQTAADLVGLILGFEDHELFLADTNGEIHLLASHEIHHISLLNPTKWSVVS